MPSVLVVHHCPTATMRRLVEALCAGADDDLITGVEVRVRPALEASATDVLDADGYLLATPANFGYMSGALKHFFDSTFLQVGGALDDSGSGSDAGSADGATAKRPFGLLVHGRYDTTGAVRSVLAITGALGWRQGFSTLEVMGEVTDADLAAAHELGGTIAALLTE